MKLEQGENKMAEGAQDVGEAGKDSNTPENNYQRYSELGGIINEEDYKNAVDRMENTHTLDMNDPGVKASVAQVKGMARRAEINMDDSGSEIDPKIILYAKLRLDAKPADVKYHHSQMGDQQIFGEVLRMLGDAESLDKLIKAYPNISFEYKK